MKRRTNLIAGLVAAILVLPGMLAGTHAGANAAEPGAGAFDNHYDITLMGMQIGVAQFRGEVRDSRYKIDIWTRLTGLAGVMTGGKGAASASGEFAGAAVLPAKFAITTAAGKKSVSVRMALAKGNVRALAIDPPPPPHPNRIALREEDKRGIVDPISALLMPVAGNVAAGDPAACNRTLPLFDGAARFDIPLSFVRAEKINGRAFAGTVAVCTGRYQPITGHRTNQPETEFMEKNRDIELWLAPQAGLFLPYRIAVRSPVGMIVIEATRFGGKEASSLRASN